MDNRPGYLRALAGEFITAPEHVIPAAVILYVQICKAHDLPPGYITRVDFHGCDADCDLHINNKGVVSVHVGSGAAFIGDRVYTLPVPQLEAVK